MADSTDYKTTVKPYTNLPESFPIDSPVVKQAPEKPTQKGDRFSTGDPKLPAFKDTTKDSLKIQVDAKGNPIPKSKEVPIHSQLTYQDPKKMDEEGLADKSKGVRYGYFYCPYVAASQVRDHMLGIKDPKDKQFKTLPPFEEAKKSYLATGKTETDWNGLTDKAKRDFYRKNILDSYREKILSEVGLKSSPRMALNPSDTNKKTIVWERIDENLSRTPPMPVELSVVYRHPTADSKNGGDGDHHILLIGKGEVKGADVKNTTYYKVAENGRDETKVKNISSEYIMVRDSSGELKAAYLTANGEIEFYKAKDKEKPWPGVGGNIYYPYTGVAIQFFEPLTISDLIPAKK